MRNQNIIISGSTGFVGQHILKYINKKKYNIFFIWNKKLKKKYKNFYYIKADLTNYDKFKKVFKNIKPDIFIHLAGLKDPRKVEKMKNYAYKINYKTNLWISNELDPNTHIIFLSTDKVYNKACKVAKETSLCKPSTLYGKLKLKTEKIFIKKFKRLHILRVPIIHSYGDKNSSFIDNLILQSKIKRKFVAKNIIRSFIKIDDLSKFIIKLINFKNYGVYNIGSKGESYFSRTKKYAIKSKNNIISCDKDKIYPVHQELKTDKLKKTFKVKFL